MVSHGPRLGDGSGSGDPPRSLPRQDRCPRATPASHEAGWQPREGEASSPTPTGALTSPAARCSRLLGFASLFRYGAVYAWIPSLSRGDCCCILQPNEQRRAPAKAAWPDGEAGPVLAALRTPTPTVEATWQARLAARRRRRRQTRDVSDWSAGADTPCGHFSPGAAPPLSLGCVQPGLTAPPTRHCAQLHAPTEPRLHAPALNNKSLLADASDPPGSVRVKVRRRFIHELAIKQKKPLDF